MQEQKKTKIVFIITKGLWGGASRYIYDIAKNLSKEEFDVNLICGKGDSLPKKMTEIGVKSYTIGHMDRDISFLSEVKSFAQIYKILRKIKPDVIHLNSPKASSFGAVIGKILSIKNIVTTIHGFTFNEDRGYIEKKIIKIITWFYMLLSDKNIIISQSDLLQARQMPFVKNKIFYIKNGIDTNTFFSSKEDARSYIQSKIKLDFEGKILLGTICELHKNKGLKYLIESMKDAEDFTLAIFGEGEERISLEKQIKNLNLSKKVFLLGFEDSNKIIKSFDVFILPSIKEGLPYVILEAGLAGLPILASEVGGIPDIIKNGENGLLFKKGNILEINQCLEKIKNENIKNKIAENIHKTVISDFSLNQMIKDTKKLYLN